MGPSRTHNMTFFPPIFCYLIQRSGNSIHIIFVHIVPSHALICVLRHKMQKRACLCVPKTPTRIQHHLDPSVWKAPLQILHHLQLQSGAVQSIWSDFCVDDFDALFATLKSFFILPVNSSG